MQAVKEASIKQKRIDIFDCNVSQSTKKTFVQGFGARPPKVPRKVLDTVAGNIFEGELELEGNLLAVRREGLLTPEQV